MPWYKEVTIFTQKPNTCIYIYMDIKIFEMKPLCISKIYKLLMDIIQFKKNTITISYLYG